MSKVEKIKAEYEEKLRLAEKEDAIERSLNMSLDVSCIGRGTYNKNKIEVYINKPWKLEDSSMLVDKEAMRTIFEVLPITENIENKDYDGLVAPCFVSTKCGYRDKYGEMRINWISGDYEISCNLKIDSELIDNFLHVQKRNVVDTESSTYVSIHESIADGVIPVVPVYNFKKKQISYYGGHNVLIDIDEIKRVLDYLMSL